MIEREARVAKDRTLISSVIRNRLKRKMPLQIDATVIYALGRHKSALTFADLKVENPYNTYRNAGLPPGPICNPGRASLEATLNPAKTSDLFFVADGTGGHTFTGTLQEHNAAVANWRRIEREREKGRPAAAGGSGPTEAGGATLSEATSEPAPTKSGGDAARKQQPRKQQPQ